MFLGLAYYYPFGMEMDMQTTQVGTPNDYTYNGKEFNDDFGLNLSDYGARWYDASIGRWHSVDPLAESMSSWSPYNYVFNNPLNFIDPDGRAPLHDYFDADGNFIGSDNRGDEVRIVSNEALKETSEMDEDEKYKFLSNNSSKFSEFQFTGKAEGAGKIGQYYLDEYLACNGAEVCTRINAPFNLPAMGYKRFKIKGDYKYSKEPPLIQIPLSGYGIAFNTTLDNKYNFINILYHELLHVDDVGFDGEYYYNHTTSKKAGDPAISLHLTTYYGQMKHPSYKNTTPSFQKDNNKYIKGYIKALDSSILKAFWNSTFGF